MTGTSISKVNRLRVLIGLENVSTNDLDRLYARLIGAPILKARFETSSGESETQEYQEVSEIGRRVVATTMIAANRILRQIRDNYGQHWLRLLDEEVELFQIQNVLDQVGCEWREGMKSWRRLLVSPNAILIVLPPINSADL